MAKILISPLGSGSKNREYRPAQYKIGEFPPYERKFIASALYDHLELDGIIFIGTVRSMWEEVYKFFCEKNKHPFDEDYWIELTEKIDSMHHQTNPQDLDLSPIKDVLGERSDCILIKYGLNNEELWENLDLIFQVVKLLKSGDEVYIDITHSFRSLSLFLFLVLTFIKDLPENENIKIAGVYYGMLDVSGEMGYTPVIDLKSLFDMTDWIKGSYILNHYGDGSLIAKLLEDQGEPIVSDQIRQLSSAININYLPAIRQRAKPLNSSLNNIAISGPFNYIKKTLTQFVKRFSSPSDKESDFQLKLAEWYFDNDRYAAGYIVLTEAIITYLCEINGNTIENEMERNAMKDSLFHLYKNSELATTYKKVNAIRKQIAHASLEENRESYSNAIDQAKNYHNKISEIFRSGRIK